MSVLVLSLYVLFWPDPGGPSGAHGVDKLVHATLFGALAAATRRRFGARLPLLGVVAAYALGSEVVQAVLLTSRSGDVLDVLADIVGACAGWLLSRPREAAGGRRSSRSR